MAGFWKRYEAAKPHIASVVDDIRHKVVEEGWFKRETSGDIAAWTPEEQAIDAERVHSGEATPMHKHASLYEEIWGREPSSTALYGPEQPTLPAPDDTKRLNGPDQDDGLTPD